MHRMKVVSRWQCRIDAGPCLGSTTTKHVCVTLVTFSVKNQACFFFLSLYLQYGGQHGHDYQEPRPSMIQLVLTVPYRKDEEL